MSRHVRACPPGTAAVTHRYSAAHANSSAFSASANANEDWTKISDLAERRRIQNRIAQRNYRKKLKRRLEDLERRAASTSASPEPVPRQLAYAAPSRAPMQRAAPINIPTLCSKYEQSPEPSYGPRSTDRESFMPIPDDRHLMSRSPPTFSYSTFANTDNLAAHYPHSPSLSSYSVPSPGFGGPSTGTSYSSNGGTYLSPRIVTSTASTPNETPGLQKSYFSQYYTPSYGYGYAGLGPYQDSSASAYARPDFLERDPFDSFDTGCFDSPRYQMWSMYQEPMPASPPFFRL